MNLFETVTTRYGSVTFFANDTGAISESLRKYGEWAENELSFMVSMVREGDTVVDVGAYIGTHSMAFARRVGPQGKVVSIEAQARSFDVLRRNITANGMGNVRLENAVASSSSREEMIPSIDIASPGSYGSASLREVLVSGRSSHVPDARGISNDDEAVRSIAVDDLSLENCSLIKIDVEGMEDVVLRGAARTIEKCRPVLYAECNSLEDGLRTFNALKELNYRVRAHVVLAYNPDNFRADAANIFDGAREVALVGTPLNTADALDGYLPRQCELLVDVETADDLALALINKPQYEGEVLRQGAAARSGGTACLDDARRLRSDLEAVQGELGRYAEQLKRASDEAEAERKARDELRAELETVRSVADRLRAERNAALDNERRLQTVLDEVHSSSSWRITAPFRTLAKALRKG